MALHRFLWEWSWKVTKVVVDPIAFRAEFLKKLEESVKNKLSDHKEIKNIESITHSNVKLTQVYGITALEGVTSTIFVVEGSPVPLAVVKAIILKITPYIAYILIGFFALLGLQTLYSLVTHLGETRKEALPLFFILMILVVIFLIRERGK